MKLESSSVIFLLSGFAITASFLIPVTLQNQSGVSTQQKREIITRLSMPPSVEIR